jgi:hypothetical protein
MNLTTQSGAVAWRHDGSGRLGLETTYFLRQNDGGWLFNGSTQATEGDVDWDVGYQLVLDPEWRTRRAAVTLRVGDDTRSVVVTADGAGHWQIDGTDAPHLDGCLDVDLESSVLTNAFPVHRMAMAVGDSAEAPAAYVRVADLAVERLAQRYTRTGDDDLGERYDYVAPAFDVHCVVAYDEAGFVRAYPGIALRV